MNIILIIILAITYILCFMGGAVWLQTKETKMGIKAKFNCQTCEAVGCQSKWCKQRRENV